MEIAALAVLLRIGRISDFIGVIPISGLNEAAGSGRRFRVRRSRRS